MCYIFFTKASLPTFKSLPPPLPPHTPCTTECDPQLQSSFLTHLPAEIRNEIYKHTFTSADDSTCNSNSPLSLLLSCHRINREATLLAFRTTTFAISNNVIPSYLFLRNQLSHLSSFQHAAITTLSHALGTNYLQGSATAQILTNALLLLPNLATFHVRVPRGRKPSAEVHYSPLLTGHTFHDTRRDAVEKYAPSWFDYKILRAVASGQCYMWQMGEKWVVQWPQVNSECRGVADYADLEENTWLEATTMADAVGVVRGVHMCVCGCAEVSWLAADLVQECGRKVGVDVVFYGGRNGRERVPLEEMEIQLRPGAEPLSVIHGPREGAGFGYAPDEKYWEELRRRNWKLDAVWRSWWRKREVMSMCSDVGENSS